jgi:GntR family transcriptional repressor for pyruvate dehydrogenase complex
LVPGEIAVVASSSLAETIVRELRDEILGERYRPGERLPSERDLAARIGANRGSVREALKKLEQQRLIEIRPGGGARVTPVQEASLDILEHLLVVDGAPDPVLTAQCLDVHELLLAGAVRFAVERGSDEELARARELLRAMSARTADETAYLTALDELTQLIHAASRNLVLQLVRNGLRSLFERRSELTQLRPPRAQLAAISKRLEKALAKRDDAAAQEATRQLVRANRERLLEAVEEERAATQPSTKR